eukprot:6466393-Amphidinium_carterae.1
MSESSAASTFHQIAAVATALPDQSTSILQSYAGTAKSYLRARFTQHIARPFVCAIMCPRAVDVWTIGCASKWFGQP